MEHLEGLLKVIDKEIGSINSRGEFSGRDEIESVYKLIDIAKDVHEIWGYEDEEDEYSNAMMRDGYYRGGSYNDGMMYDDRGSYARGRGSRDHRDGMGRYSSRNIYRRDGYSRADKAEYMNNLRMMMNDAPDEQTRESMRRMIDQMGNQ